MVGNLETYYEVGMDHLEFKLNCGESSVLLTGGQNLKVYNKDGDVVYKGPLLKVKDSEYSHGFIPHEVATDEWYSWFREGLRAEIYTEDNNG